MPMPKGYKHSEETKNKMSLAHKGRIFSEEHRLKISESKKNYWNSNPEVRKIQSERFKGEKSSFWRGGITEKSKLIRVSSEYRLWRTSVFKRDNYSCQECRDRGGNGHKVILNADHIKPFSTHPDLRFDVANGRTLCLPCHRKTETWGGITKFKKKQHASTHILSL